MPDTNPLRKESRPQEQASGEEMTRIQTDQIVSFDFPDGTQRRHILESRLSSPQDDGTYHETVMNSAIFDHGGNALYFTDPTKVIISHSGLWINTPEEGAICTHWLHPSRRSRNIRIGQDGVQTPTGAICSHCQSTRNSLYMATGLLLIGLLIGLFQGAWR